MPPTQIRRWSVTVAVVALIVGSISACASPESSLEPDVAIEIPAAFSDPNADGTDLANAWFELLSLTGSGVGIEGATPEQVAAGRELIAPYLDPAFQLQRASGERYTAASYVPIDLDTFEVANVISTAPTETIRAIRYAVRTPDETALDTSMVFSDELTPRLTVFRWDEQLGHWVIVSHANFNNPVAAICTNQDITTSEVEVTTSAADQSLGESLVAQWRDISTGKLKEKVRHPEAVIQLADGQGWPSTQDEEVNWSPAQAYDFQNLEVTRNQDLLVASYDAVVSELEMEGAEYRAASSPRLLTWLKNSAGKWELIGLANFTVPQQIPASLDCG